MTLQEIGITNEQIIDTIVDKLTEEVRESILAGVCKDVTKKAQDQISDALNAVVTETAFKALETQFQPTDQYGDKSGPVTSVREIFWKKTIAWWDQKVDNEGKPSNGYYAKCTMAQWHAEKAVEAAVKKELTENLQKIISDAKQQIATAITETITQMVARQLK